MQAAGASAKDSTGKREQPDAALPAERHAQSKPPAHNNPTMR